MTSLPRSVSYHMVLLGKNGLMWPRGEPRYKLEEFVVLKIIDIHLGLPSPQLLRSNW